MKPLLAVVGNTGVGKSQLAVELALKFNGEIVNGDSMQMYTGIPIVTNKHPDSEQKGIPHHLLGHVPWSEPYSVHQFEAEALKVINDIHQRGKLPILVGGTHYYIQSIISNGALIGHRDQPARKMTTTERESLDDPVAVEKNLRAIDPKVLSKFHPNDTRRLRRALEVYYTTGRIASELYRDQRSSSSARFKTLCFWLYADKPVLNERLDKRVDAMVEQGLMTELEQLHGGRTTTAISDSTGVWQVLGYSQLVPYLSGQDDTIESGIEAMKAETRQYAKKQTKWIVNKLAPFLESLGATFAALDATNLSTWNKDVGERGFRITKHWLDETPFEEPLLLENVKSSRARQAYDGSQWTRYKCETCSQKKSKEVVVMGDDEWTAHLASKAHKKIVQAASRKRPWLDSKESD